MLILFLTLLLSFSLQAKTLVLIGGGERPASALEYFLSKKKNGPILVLPWGTQYPQESFNTIKSELQKLGANQLYCLCQITTSPEDIQLLQTAGAIYFPGGDQNLIMQRIFQSDTASLIKALYENNVPVAGTSAGTAIQSNPMLTGVGAQTGLGLGLLKYFLIDQHFLVRNRQARLIEALQSNSGLHGIGIDENMSLVVEDNQHFLALGPSQVVLYLRQGDDFQKMILQNGQRYFHP
jgi:cyanophycinase